MLGETIESVRGMLYDYLRNAVHQLHVYVVHPSTATWHLIEHAFVAIILIRFVYGLLFPREGANLDLLVWRL